MAHKEYLKMADVFPSEVRVGGDSDNLIIDDVGIIIGCYSGDKMAEHVLHAINSHDELAAEVERLRGALTSSRLALSNAAMNMKWFDISKAQEILREVNSIDKLISAIGTSDAKI